MKTFLRVAEGIIIAMIVMSAIAIILRTILNVIIK